MASCGRLPALPDYKQMLFLEVTNVEVRRNGNKIKNYDVVKRQQADHFWTL